MMQVKVRAILPRPGTVWLGLGLAEDGSTITWAGDWRAMVELRRALILGAPDVVADVPDWAVVGCEGPGESGPEGGE
jgi:hypothetical protein